MRSIQCIAGTLITAVTIAASLTSCGTGTTASNAATALFHKLDWGASYLSSPVWSPNGSSIALFMGHDESDAHLFVVSADGSKQQDEAAWQCNESNGAAIAWLPDGGLSCVAPSADGSSLDLSIAANLSAPVKSFVVPGGTAGGQYGAFWLPDGSALLASETVDVPPGTYRLDRVTSLHVITRDGKAAQSIVIPNDLAWPRWANGTSTPTLSYQTFATNPPYLATSKVTWTPGGTVTLGESTPVPGGQSILQSFTWSPTGQWFAATRPVTSGGGCAFGGDCVVTNTLIVTNPDSPEQALRVPLPGTSKPTESNLAGQGLAVAWSPDGQTILTTQMEDDGRTHLYSFDIGKYLASQGQAI
jgi:hypothetical protein